MARGPDFGYSDVFYLNLLLFPDACKAQSYLTSKMQSTQTATTVNRHWFNMIQYDSMKKTEVGEMILIWLICGSHSRSGWNGCSLNTLNTVIYLDYQSWCPCLRIPEEIRKKDATQVTTQGVWGPPDAEFNWCEEEPNVVYDSGKSRFDLHCMHTYLSGHSQDSVQSAWVRAHVLACPRYTATQSCQRASSPAVTKEYELRMSMRTYISYYDYILYSTYIVCIMSVVVWMSCILWTLLFIVTVEKRTTRSFFLSDWRGSLRLLPTHFAGHARTISCPSGLRNPWILPHASSWFCSPSCSWQRMRLANMIYKYQFKILLPCRKYKFISHSHSRIYKIFKGNQFVLKVWSPVLKSNDSDCV